jgi:hypothetical protein
MPFFIASSFMVHIIVAAQLGIVYSIMTSNNGRSR